VHTKQKEAILHAGKKRKRRTVTGQEKQAREKEPTAETASDIARTVVKQKQKAVSAEKKRRNRLHPEQQKERLSRKNNGIQGELWQKLPFRLLCWWHCGLLCCIHFWMAGQR